MTELSEMALDVLRRMQIGGTFPRNEFDPEIVTELQDQMLVRWFKGDRVGISDSGRRFVAELKSKNGRMPALKPYWKNANSDIVKASDIPVEMKGTLAPDEVQSAHQALDEFGVPDKFYDTPLSLTSRIRILIDNIGKEERDRLSRRFSRNVALATSAEEKK